MAEEKKIAKKTPGKDKEEKATVDTKVVEETKPEKKDTKPKVRTFDKNDDVEIMNNTTGRYGYSARSGFAVEMEEYGDILSIPFGELKTMRSTQKRHIEDAFIVILDEDAVKELKLEKLYENVLDAEGVEDVLNDKEHGHERLDKMLPKMPTGMREVVAEIATRKFRSGELYDMRIKKVLEDNLDIKIEG